MPTLLALDESSVSRHSANRSLQKVPAVPGPIPIASEWLQPQGRQQVVLRDQQIVDRHRNGRSQVAIALEFGISQSRVSQILRYLGHGFEQKQLAQQSGLRLTGLMLQNARLKAGITQMQFASQLGVSKVTVGNWERGKQRIPAGRIDQLYRLLTPFLTEIGPNSTEQHAA